jgi:hypothetical protein
MSTPVLVAEATIGVVVPDSIRTHSKSHLVNRYFQELEATSALALESASKGLNDISEFCMFSRNPKS